MQGMMTVFRKELADHFTSWRFLILFTIVFAVGIFAIYEDAQFIREEASQIAFIFPERFVFLLLFTTAGQTPLPLFILFMAFFVPIVGISLGFDAINSERNSGTLSRVLAQPIYRDAVINGKFLAGVTTIAIMLTSMVLVVAGLGLRMIGVPPSSEEAFRLLTYLIMSIIYSSFWLSLAILFSIFFQRVATSILASISFWMLFSFMFILPAFAQLGGAEVIAQISPVVLFLRVTDLLLIPVTEPPGGLISILSVGQSLLTAWPYMVSLIALTVICFAISYIKFMREEIRST